jgi:hypothetical protein
MACTIDLSDLLLGQSSQSRHFLNHSRKYSIAFQMTIFGCKKREIEGNYMPTFKVQGHVYHLIGSLLPNSGEQTQFLQVYFLGNSAEETRRRGTIASDTRMEIICPLQTMLHNSHKSISIFKTRLQTLQSQGQPYNHKIVIRPEQAPTGEHRRTYNAPEAIEVAMLIMGQNEKMTNRDIVLENHKPVETCG